MLRPDYEVPPLMSQPGSEALREACDLVDALAAAVAAGRNHILTEVSIRRPELALALAVVLHRQLPDASQSWLEREGPNVARAALCRLLKDDLEGGRLVRFAIEGGFDQPARPRHG